MYKIDGYSSYNCISMCLDKISVMQIKCMSQTKEDWCQRVMVYFYWKQKGGKCACIRYISISIWTINNKIKLYIEPICICICKLLKIMLSKKMAQKIKTTKLFILFKITSNMQQGLNPLLGVFADNYNSNWITKCFNLWYLLFI